MTLELYWLENCPYCNSRVVIYACKMFIRLATAVNVIVNLQYYVEEEAELWLAKTSRLPFGATKKSALFKLRYAELNFVNVKLQDSVTKLLCWNEAALWLAKTSHLTCNIQW